MTLASLELMQATHTHIQIHTRANTQHILTCIHASMRVQIHSPKSEGPEYYSGYSEWQTKIFILRELIHRRIPSTWQNNESKNSRL